MSLDLTGFSPALRQAILNRLNKVEPEEREELTELEIEEIAEKVIEDETGANGAKVLNMDANLTSLERGLYLQTDGAKVLTSASDNFAVRGASVAMCRQLAKLGIIELDADGKVIQSSFNRELAKQITGIDAESWLDFINVNDGSGKFWDNAYSVEELDGIPSIEIDKYFIGPALLAETEEDANSGNLKLYYTINLAALEKDYPGVKTLDELKEALAAEYTNSHNVNGEIDEWIGQGGNGDCWLLAGALALASTETGRQIINDSIHPQADGSVIVEFKGAYDANGNPVKITISADEIAAFDSDTDSTDLFSNGDNDMLVLELAMNKLEYLILKGEVVLPTSNSTYGTMPDYKVYDDGFVSFVEGSFASRMISMLTGVDAEHYWDNLNRENIYQILSNAAENPGTVLSFGLYKGTHSAKQQDGEYYEFTFESGHAFAITDVHEELDKNGNVDYDKSTVTFVNPWNSTEKITLSWNEFVNLDVGMMTSTSINGTAAGTTPKPEGSQMYIIDDIYEALTNDDKFLYDLLQFVEGNMTVEQLQAVLRDRYGIEISGVEEQGENTVIKFTDDAGENITIICNTNAVKDGVRGDKGNELNLFQSKDGLTFDGVTFTPEEVAKYFISVLSFDYEGQSYNMGVYSPSENWPNGVTTPAELRVYLDINLENPEIKKYDGSSDASFDDIINAIPEDNKILTDDIVELLKQAKSGDINALLDLSLYGFEIADAVVKNDGSFDVKVTLNGVSYTFNYSSDKKDMLIFAGLLKPDSAGETRNDNNSYKFASLEEAIEKMGLRKTNCKGVYCQQHNPNKPAGDYSELVHYVWNEATHEMIELKDVYHITSNGNQAKGLEGYEEVLAYQQGYNFTSEKGIYEKNGKKYQFDKKTFEFVEIQKSETRSKNINNSKSSETPEIVKYLNSQGFTSYMQNLNNWCIQNNYTMNVLGLDGDEFIIELYDKNGNKYGGQIVINNDGSVQFDTNYSETSITAPPLPKFSVK